MQWSCLDTCTVRASLKGGFPAFGRQTSYVEPKAHFRPDDVVPSTVACQRKSFEAFSSANFKRIAVELASG